MKKRFLCLLLTLCLMLGGCGWFSGSYISVEPHREPDTHIDTDGVSAANYQQLCRALENMIRAGRENGIINVEEYNQSVVEKSMTVAANYAANTYPIGAYAVESIQFEVGTNAGKPAIAVTIAYRHSQVEIQKIIRVRGMEEASQKMAESLEKCQADVVLLIEDYSEMDIAQMVTDFAARNPQTVMETPQVTVGIYPETGSERVVALTYTYQTSRDTLRQMRTQVEPVFDAAVLYVSGDGADEQKYAQLYAFLMERFDYEIATSITPAYSLLRHGVGDERAFSTVYAAMCRMAGLECWTVSGTCDGEPWTWNIVEDDGRHYHVDLLRCSQAGGFREFSDEDMTGYVWDYSAYPACPPEVVQPVDDTQPEQEETEPEK